MKGGQRELMQRRVFGLAILIAVGAGAGYWVGSKWPAQSHPAAVPTALKATLWPRPRSLEPFLLSDQHGRPFELSRLKGRWTLLFFGYASCPDICPTTLMALRKAAARMSDHAGGEPIPQIAFVSVDPERDDPQRLGAYVQHFHPAFLGVTGTLENVKGLARQLNVMFMREKGSSESGYVISHTSSILVIDPRARLYARFSPPHYGEAIAERFEAVRRYYAGNG